MYTISTCTVYVCVHVDQYSSQLTEDVHPKRVDPGFCQMYSLIRPVEKRYQDFFQSLGGKPTNPCAPFLQILDPPLQWRIYGGGGGGGCSPKYACEHLQIQNCWEEDPQSDSRTPRLPSNLDPRLPCTMFV